MITDSTLVLGLRGAGAFHFATLGLACLTPIPPDWERSLAALPVIHRRFALAQNVTIGAVIAGFGAFSLRFAPELVAGTPLGRAICLATALFWGGRLIALPWLNAHTCCATPWLKAGLGLLLLECAAYAGIYGWLAFRTPGCRPV